jgi:phytanoyl-CoA hydroxylase
MAERLEILHRHLNGHRHTAVFSPTSAAPDLLSAFPSSIQPYKFTVDSGTLTPAQREFYEQNGFIVMKNVVPKEKLAVYRKRFQDICTGAVSTFGMTVMRDIAIAKSEFMSGERAITKLQDFQWDEVLFSYCQLPEVLRYVRDFIGPNVMATHTMLINKPPDPGTLTSRHPMHQDLYYFPFRPAERVVCAWTAMQPITRANGCLVVIPGSHNSELLEHDYPKWEGGVNKMYHGILDYDPERQDRVWVEMDEGDTVFFHPLLIHGSGTNRTDGFRKSISCHYAASECEYVETEGSRQEKIANEIVELVRVKSRSHAKVSYKDVWKYKSRLACGEHVNM